MVATTHQEVYRPFRGTLRRRALRFWPVFTANVSVACKKRLPVLLIYAVPAIATVIFSFVVYLRYAAEAAQLPEAASGGSTLVDMVAQRALKNLEVRRQIAMFLSSMQFFALIPAAWFGSGLFADDLRVGAHQLYFSRPMTRGDYFLGKLLTAAFFTTCAVWVPCLVICLVASFASENWSFLTEEGDVLGLATLYSLVWVLVTSSLALCVSSLAPKKLFALVGFFAVTMILHVFGDVMSRLLEDLDYQAISPLFNLGRIASWLFDLEDRSPPFHLGLAWSALAAFSALCLTTVAVRLRRLEVVA